MGRRDLGAVNESAVRASHVRDDELPHLPADLGMTSGTLFVIQEDGHTLLAADDHWLFR